MTKLLVPRSLQFFSSENSIEMNNNMAHEHRYKLTAQWHGNKGTGTSGVREYDRSHMLSYLYVCALEGVIVTDYVDHATGIMIEETKGGGQFKEVTLNPIITVANDSMIEKALELHHNAHEMCYIANSVNFEVKCNPVCKSN